jgi:hypothetical protein
MQTYNVYCDESCHLINDQQKVMVLGAVWCPKDKAREISIRLREIRERNSISKWMEVKWTKVSPARLQFYLDLVDYFFDDDDLHFRALVVPNKSLLDHERYQQDHDTWYYKMYYDMLKVFINPSEQYCIYLDIKDTRSAKKVTKLHEILSNSQWDFRKESILGVQNVRSEDIRAIQLADLLVGAVGYANRQLSSSNAKMQIVHRIRERSGLSLVKTTAIAESKVNIFIWEAS